MVAMVTAALIIEDFPVYVFFPGLAVQIYFFHPLIITSCKKPSHYTHAVTFNAVMLQYINHLV